MLCRNFSCLSGSQILVTLLSWEIQLCSLKIGSYWLFLITHIGCNCCGKRTRFNLLLNDDRGGVRPLSNKVEYAMSWSWFHKNHPCMTTSFSAVWRKWMAHLLITAKLLKNKLLLVISLVVESTACIARKKMAKIRVLEHFWVYFVITAAAAAIFVFYQSCILFSGASYQKMIFN